MKFNNLGLIRPGHTIKGKMACKRKVGDLVYMGKEGSRDFKGAKGGCKFGWRYQYKAKDGTMKYGCANRKTSPFIRIAEIEEGMLMLMPPVKRRGPRGPKTAKAPSGPNIGRGSLRSRKK
jgi:hypothetical protein